MGGDDKKVEKVTPSTANTVFKGVQSSFTDLPGFGSAATQIEGPKNNRTVTNTFTPDAQVASILQGAKQGIANNQSIFNLTPEQQFAQIEQNPYYQYAKTQDKNFLTQGQAEARQAASQSGLENSTVAGAIEATLLQDAVERDMASRLGALDYSRALAGENLGMQQDLMNQIHGYTMAPLQLSNSTLMDAANSQDQVGMFNAGQIQQAGIANTQMVNQARQAAAARRSALIGNLIASGAALGAAPISGGSSLAGAAFKSLGGFLRK